MSEVLTRIEVLVAEIEVLDAATAGQFRQDEDREAYDIIGRIERKLAQQTQADEHGIMTRTIRSA